MKVDAVAIGMSGLCVVHCLALPVLASAAPVLGVISEAEWLHRLLVIMALPLALLAFTRTPSRSAQIAFGLPAIIGSVLLFLGASAEPLHDYETLLTVIGAVFLGGAHILRWRTHQA
ncbi:MAG: MerC domain-containing protein [Pseudomonadota bacterium]